LGAEEKGFAGVTRGLRIAIQKPIKSVRGKIYRTRASTEFRAGAHSYLAASRSLSLRKVWPCLPVLHTRGNGSNEITYELCRGFAGENRTMGRGGALHSGSILRISRAPPRLLARLNKVDGYLYRIVSNTISRRSSFENAAPFTRHIADIPPRDIRYTIFDRDCDGVD